MGMSQYNRQNPFMYVLEMKQQELIDKTAYTIKNSIGLMIVTAICFILAVISHIINSNSSFFLFLYFVVMNFILIIISLRYVTRENKKREVDQMIFGDQYKYIDLNNEQLLSQINEFNVCIGRIEILHETISYFKVIYSIMLIKYIVDILLLIFK